MSKAYLIILPFCPYRYLLTASLLAFETIASFTQMWLNSKGLTETKSLQVLRNQWCRWQMREIPSNTLMKGKATVWAQARSIPWFTCCCQGGSQENGRESSGWSSRNGLDNVGGLCNRRCQDAVGRDEKGCRTNTGKEIRWQYSKDSLFSRDVASWSTQLVLEALRNCFC